MAFRLNSLARLHDLLVQEDWRGVSLLALVQAQIQALTGRAVAGGPDLVLKPSAAQTLSMAFHELATNALKYGALSESEGRVVISWSQNADFVQIFWREVGGPVVTPPERQGLGSLVLQRASLQILGASANLTFPKEGIIWEFRAPLKSLAEVDALHAASAAQ